MRKEIIFIFILFSWSGYSQEYMKEVTSLVCDCVNKLDGPTFNKAVFDCLKEGVYKKAIPEKDYQELVKKASESQGNKTNDNGYKLGYGFSNDIIKNLIDDCPAFFELYEKQREEARLKSKGLYSRKYLDSINQKGGITWEFLFNRGSLNFSYDNYDLAIKDFERMKNVYSSNSASYFFLGWIYEKKKEYSKALEYYNQSLAKKWDNNTVLSIKVVQKKMRDQK